MALNLLTNTKVWLDGYDMSGFMNALALEYGAEPKDITTFGASTRIRRGGIKTVAFNHAGLWDEVADQQFFERVGVSDTVMTIGPETGADGEFGYAVRSLVGQYAPGETVGEMLAFSVSGEASNNDLVRGTIMHNATKTVTGVGTGRQLGAVPTGGKVHASLHVIARSGTASPTLTVKIQSDDANGWGTPTDRITFTAATAIGGQFQSTTISGFVTDTWWRVSYTISGTTPSFTFIVLIALTA